MFFGSFSTKVPEPQDEAWSDDPLAGEHLPGSGVSGAGAKPGVDGRVFGEVDVGVQYMGADGVLEGWITVLSQWLGRSPATRQRQSYSPSSAAPPNDQPPPP